MTDKFDVIEAEWQKWTRYIWWRAMIELREAGK